LRRHQYDLPSYVNFLVSSAVNFTMVWAIIKTLNLLEIICHHSFFRELVSQSSCLQKFLKSIKWCIFPFVGALQIHQIFLITAFCITSTSPDKYPHRHVL
jgi:hypothetical protein